MQRFLCLLILLYCITVVASAQPQPKELIGYYPSWKWKSRDNFVTPSKLPFDKLTMVNYAFFVPRPDGTITGKDSVGDRLYLEGGLGPTLVALAHQHGVKVLLSLGGWTDSERFSLVAGSDSLRAVFSLSCQEVMLRYGFDGIDIDWEFPGYAGHKGTPADKRNFTLLLSSLREGLTALGERTGQSYLLTAALPAGGEHVRNIEVGKVAEILDQLNLMTYDYYGSWDSIANHNSPLYPSAGADSSRCVDASYRLYHDSLGVPGSKINIGVPFYGKAYAGCTTLSSTHAGVDTVNFPAGGPCYYDIFPVLGSFTRLWDEKAVVPYLVSESRHVLVSYDDEESIRSKAKYVVDHGIHGVIIWEITGDVLPDGTTPLLNALNGTLHEGREAVR